MTMTAMQNRQPPSKANPALKSVQPIYLHLAGRAVTVTRSCPAPASAFLCLVLCSTLIDGQ